MPVNQIQFHLFIITAELTTNLTQPPGNFQPFVITQAQISEQLTVCNLLKNTSSFHTPIARGAIDRLLSARDVAT